MARSVIFPIRPAPLWRGTTDTRAIVHCFGLLPEANVWIVECVRFPKWTLDLPLKTPLAIQYRVCDFISAHQKYHRTQRLLQPSHHPQLTFRLLHPNARSQLLSPLWSGFAELVLAGLEN